MQYLIAYLLKGDAAVFHRNLSDAIAKRRKLTPVTERIMPHLTLKAPFEAEDISPIEEILELFSQKESPQPFSLSGFETFDGRVVYMSVQAPKQTHMLIRRLQDQLRNVSWLTFHKYEFPITLHATLAYPKSPESAKEILRDLRKEKASFDCMVDSISLLQKPEDKWERIHEYNFAN